MSRLQRVHELDCEPRVNQVFSDPLLDLRCLLETSDELYGAILCCSAAEMFSRL